MSRAVAIRLRVEPPAPAWAGTMSFQIPRALVERFGWEASLGAGGDLTIAASPGVLSPEHARVVREHAAFTDAPPLSARLPVSYRRAPAWARSTVAAVIGRRRRGRTDQWAAFPGWQIGRAHV